MILVDTSVLIDFLKGNSNRKTDLFVAILDKGLPFGINNFIYQELLQGCRTLRDFMLLRSYLGNQKFYDFKSGRDSYADAAMIYFKLRKKGITIRSTIDCLIAQMTIENNLYLLHNDNDFTQISDIIPMKIWEG
ncbi:MAG: PIN domain nuclease [Candidatus Omnitrophota bacterium]